MAEVDFSNVVLEPYGNRPLGASDLGFHVDNLYSLSGSVISTNSSKQVLDSGNKRSYIYTGRFNTSGTEFYLVDGGNTYQRWKFSNISFQNGDTYNFQVDTILDN